MIGLTFLSTISGGHLSPFTAKSHNKYFWKFLKKEYLNRKRANNFFVRIVICFWLTVTYTEIVKNVEPKPKVINAKPAQLFSIT